MTEDKLSEFREVVEFISTEPGNYDLNTIVDFPKTLSILLLSISTKVSRVMVAKNTQAVQKL